VISIGEDPTIGRALARKLFNPPSISRQDLKATVDASSINSRMPKRRRMKVRGPVATLATQQKP
jgi:hypothetical protein